MVFGLFGGGNGRVSGGTAFVSGGRAEPVSAASLAGGGPVLISAGNNVANLQHQIGQMFGVDPGRFVRTGVQWTQQGARRLIDFGQVLTTYETTNETRGGAFRRRAIPINVQDFRFSSFEDIRAAGRPVANASGFVAPQSLEIFQNNPGLNFGLDLNRAAESAAFDSFRLTPGLIEELQASDPALARIALESPNLRAAADSVNRLRQQRAAQSAASQQRQTAARPSPDDGQTTSGSAPDGGQTTESTTSEAGGGADGPEEMRRRRTRQRLVGVNLPDARRTTIATSPLGLSGQASVRRTLLGGA